MGCCNKTHDGRPISKLRYYGGLVILGSAQVGALAAIGALSVPFPRYRKVLPFFGDYAMDTFREAFRRERMTVEGLDGTEEAGEQCADQGDGGGEQVYVWLRYEGRSARKNGDDAQGSCSARLRALSARINRS